MNDAGFICIALLATSQMMLAFSVFRLYDAVAKNTAMRKAILHVICGKDEVD